MKRGNLNVFFILFLGAALIPGGVNKAKAETESGGISIDLKSADIKVRIESERLEKEQMRKVKNKKDTEKQDAKNKKELENQESKKIKETLAKQADGREALEKKEAKILKESSKPLSLLENKSVGTEQCSVPTKAEIPEPVPSEARDPLHPFKSPPEEFKKPYKSKSGLLAFQAEIHYKEGLSLQGSGNQGEAKVCYHKVILLDHQYAPAYNQLGIISQEEDLLEEAKAYYLKAMEADPKFAPAYSNLALLAEAESDFEKAAEYWQKRSKLGRKRAPWVKLAKKRLKEINAHR